MNRMGFPKETALGKFLGSTLELPLICLTHSKLAPKAALAGRIDVDFASEPLGRTSDGRAVYLKDLWPSFEDGKG